MSARPVSDRAVRERALDARRSFIVQAPAGSGKTGLLIQRYLTLLARVNDPEEVIAITFTRKAAGEMRERVSRALAQCDAGASDADAHEQLTLSLARQVRRRDGELGWQLARQPGRMRILTIDALCRAIATRMPWVSRLGGDIGIAEDASPLYRRAARDTLALIYEEPEWSEPVATLLDHLDGDMTRFEALLVRMLSRRDQWLRYLRPAAVAGDARRSELESALARTVRDELAVLRDAVPAELATELVAVCAHAGAELAERGADSPVIACAGMSALPGSSPADLAPWRGISALLLTQPGTWRRRVSAREGFPAGGAPQAARMKARFGELSAALADDDRLRACLRDARELPDPAYTDAQWRALEALLQVLPLAAANLRLAFAARGQADYIEMTSAARQALGDAESPGDVALALDYRVRHILVDEFQDTSHSHHALLAQLTAGWQPDDGRTLFLVGDPMQSIYRFREADVGVFLRVAERGLPSVRLESLTLSENFRSRPAVVEWLNRVFPHVMPRGDDAITGAVRYTPCSAHEGEDTGAGVHVQLLRDADRAAEAERVVALVRTARDRDAAASVALLARTRTHLAAILPRLRAAGIAYHGIDIESLAERPVVIDLLALTRALLHPADRTAWLAVLRAPWCGLLLDDLLLLAGGAPETPLLERLRDPAVTAALGVDAAERVARLMVVIEAALRDHGRWPARRWIEGVWSALGGPACVSAADLRNAATFLDLLEALDAGEGRLELDELARRAAELYAVSDAGNAELEVMTVHKAKGLEFDVVIVPGIDRVGRGDEPPLLAWTQRADDDDSIVLAPIPSAAGEGSRIYEFLRHLERKKATHELARLLYVAATRARRSLHLVGSVRSRDDGNGVRPPAEGSMLAALWPALGQALQRELEAAPEAARGAAQTAEPWSLRRLPLAWRPPPPPPSVSPAAFMDQPSGNATTAVPFEWAGELARHVGTVVHHEMRRLSRMAPTSWQPDALPSRRPAWRAMLTGLGIPAADLGEALERIETAVRNVLDDQRGRWLLDPAHQEARSELALSGVDGGALVNVVIDRTFVDEEGVRWIVDYKSGRHGGGDVEAFLDQEQARYRGQLERYARLLAAMERRPIRLALYFPAHRAWRTWAFAGRSGA